MLYPKLHCLLCIFKFIIGGQDDELSIFIQCIYLFNQIQAGQQRHSDISQYDIWIFIQYHIIGFQAVFDAANQIQTKTLPVNQVGYRFPYDFLIISNQYF